MAGFATVSRRPHRPTTEAPRISRLWWFTGPVLITLIAAMVTVGAMKVPYRTFSPGRARSVEPLVTVDRRAGSPPVTVDRPDPDLLYVTVSVGDPTAFGALLGVLDDRVQVEPSKPYLGTLTTAEDRRLSLALMATSQDQARAVALRRLGYQVTVGRNGAFVQDVNPAYPVADQVEPGATVVSADGKAVRAATDLVAVIRAHRPGDTISLGVRPLGQAATMTLRIRLGGRPGDPTVATLGVTLSDSATYRFPFDVRIDTGKVGGPSAGLAFTLAILDRFSPGRLLGTQRVAVTGTIELDGSIGPVGGVDHKTRAAIREGAKLFIVPPEEYALAKAVAGTRLRVARAGTLAEALGVLRRSGGDPLPAAPAP